MSGRSTLLWCQTWSPPSGFSLLFLLEISEAVAWIEINNTACFPLLVNIQADKRVQGCLWPLKSFFIGFLICLAVYLSVLMLWIREIKSWPRESVFINPPTSQLLLTSLWGENRKLRFLSDESLPETNLLFLHFLLFYILLLLFKTEASIS